MLPSTRLQPQSNNQQAADAGGAFGGAGGSGVRCMEMSHSRSNPNTRIKMEQPRHSLPPHLDSFTESNPGAFLHRKNLIRTS